LFFFHGKFHCTPLRNDCWNYCFMWAVQWVTCDSVLHSHLVLQYAHSKQQLLRDKSSISVRNHQTNWHSSLNCTDVFLNPWRRNSLNVTSTTLKAYYLPGEWLGCISELKSCQLQSCWQGHLHWQVSCRLLLSVMYAGVGELRILKLLARQVQHRQSRKHKDIVIDIKAAYNECQEKYKSWGTGVKGVQMWSWPFTPSSAEVKDKGSYTSSPSLCVHSLGRVGFTHLDKMWQHLAQ